MKQAIALRIDPDLLADVRRCAADENRTLTNFIETVLKTCVNERSQASNGKSDRKATMPTRTRLGSRRGSGAEGDRQAQHG
jgi:hypothetical protein